MGQARQRKEMCRWQQPPQRCPCLVLLLVKDASRTPRKKNAANAHRKTQVLATHTAAGANLRGSSVRRAHNPFPTLLEVLPQPPTPLRYTRVLKPRRLCAAACSGPLPLPSKRSSEASRITTGGATPFHSGRGREAVFVLFRRKLYATTKRSSEVLHVLVLGRGRRVEQMSFF